MPRLPWSSLTPIAVVAVVALPACAHEANGEVIGSSHSAMAAPAARADAGAADGDPQLPAGWRDSFAQLGTLPVSRGHGTGSWPMSVYGDERAAKALRDHDDASAGATFVAIHPSKSGELLFVMQKTDDGDAGATSSRWHYRVRDVDGVTVDPPGCETCHTQAPHDHLFILAAGAGR